MIDGPQLHPDIVVIPPELLDKASPEEREAYFQYLIQEVKRVDDWESWLRLLFPQFAGLPFSPGHKDFWEWVWSVDPTNKPRPWISIWPRGHGKRLTSSTPILTTAGWSSMGDLRVGDQVFGPDGEATKVTWLSETNERPLYRVEFSDGFVLDADPEHEWTVLDRGPYEWRTLETQQILKQKFYTGDRCRFQLPHREALQFAEADLPITPYLMGLWLGDGNAQTGVIACDAPDADETIMLVEATGEIVKSHYVQQNTGCHYILAEGIRRRLATNGFLGKKRIPSSYMTASESQRRQLLAGLVDSDGHIDKKRGRVRYVSHDEDLARDVRLLARSLGYNATTWTEVDEREPHPITDLNGVVTMIKTAGTRWVSSWTPHDGRGQGLFARKQVPVFARRERVGIKSIERIDPAPGLCIEVDREDGLFLAGEGLTPTHNSTSAELAVTALAARGKRKYGLYICETQDQADDHVANIASMLESSSIELAYPDLGKPAVNKQGQSKGWRRNRIVTASGFILDACGLDSAARGIKFEAQRPDFMVFDDIDGELDGEAVTLKKIKVITQKLLPAGSPNCATLMVQNLVHENSIFAQLSDGRADFLRNRIVSGPIPAVNDLEVEEQEFEDAKTGDKIRRWVITAGEATWPEGFSIATCEALINEFGLTAFMAECQHVTEPPDGEIFSHLVYSHVDFDDLPRLKRVVVWVDPAVSSNETSDSMGIQCDGLGIDGKIYRLWSWEQRSTPYAAIKKAILKGIEYDADVVGIETNQGDQLWRVVYDQAMEDIRNEAASKIDPITGKKGDFFKKMPRYKEKKATRDLGSKVMRAERMLVDYERFVFVHVNGTHVTLEKALKRFPKIKPYDLVDASYWCWSELAGPMHRRKVKLSSSARRAMATGMGIANAPHR